MCGLVGCYGDVDLEAKKIFSTLLLIDVFRGADSTGVAVVYEGNNTNRKVEEDKDFEIHKCVGGPWGLMNDDKIWDTKGGYIKNLSPDLLIGHNRLSTVGETNLANAHPFQIGDIIGAHNGTLNDDTLKEYDFYKDYEVDSQVLMRAIHESTIKEAYGSIAGAIALTWWDRYEQSFNIIRNSHRPLHCCYQSDKKTLYWASEAWMLKAAFARSHRGMSPDGIMYFEPHMHYTVGKKNGNVKFLETEKLVQKTAPVRSTTSNSSSLWPKRGEDNKETRYGTKVTPPYKDPGKSQLNYQDYKDVDILNSSYLAHGYGRYILTKSMFEHLVKQSGGCTVCCSDIEWKDKNGVKWMAAHAPVCYDCRDVADQWDKAGDDSKNNDVTMN